jgi:dCTP deaminase
MMVYSDTKIRHALERGHIVCYPLVEENIRGSSIDVTLGHHYYTTQNLGEGTLGFNPYNAFDVDRYFRHWVAEPHEVACARLGLQLFDNIEPGWPIIVLAPGQRILAHTHEWIGINPPGTTEMRARSSMGRIGVTVCKCAGWGDPGFIDRWTMEVENTNRHHVALRVGERVAQIIFHHTGPVDQHYGKTGKYQGGTDLYDLVANWHERKMLPRLHEDRPARPIQPDPEDARRIITEALALVAAEEQRLEEDANAMSN